MPKMQPKWSEWENVIFLALLWLCVVSALLLIMQKHRSQVLTKILSEELHRESLLLQEQGRLLLEESAWFSLSRVDQFARKHLSMHDLAPYHIRIVRVEHYDDERLVDVSMRSDRGN